MEELIKITENGGVQTVSGRELHEALQIRTAYKDWFPRMCEYGFTEEEDFCSILSESSGGRPQTDHIIKLDMAKEICMIQRTEIGKKIRQYFIQAEKQLRTLQTPDSYMIDDPIKRANRWIEEQQAHQQEIKALESQVAVKDQQISLMEPKVNYCDQILQSEDLIPISIISKDYGLSGQQLNTILCEAGIQFKRGKIWLLYQKYAEMGLAQSKSYPIEHSNGRPGAKNHTYWTPQGRLFIYELLKKQGILPIVERPRQLELLPYDFKGITEVYTPSEASIYDHQSKA